MEISNLSRLKEKNAAADFSSLKAMYARIRLSALYEFLYTNAEFRLNLLADKIHTLYPDISEARVKTEMTLWEISSILYENPPRLSASTLDPLLSKPSAEYKLYLSVIFEIIFLPLYIAKNNRV